MLREIRCEKFRVKNIAFKEGLNVVLGDKNATNSIGKSTLLMIIDFAFGGNSLLKHNTDLVNELGDHEYFFVFEFEQERYRFRRGTLEPDQVYRCDEEFQPEAILSLTAYLALLKQCYAIGHLEMTYRSLIGTYARVWGKDNLDVHKPLHVVPTSKASDCVTNLVKTFNRYGQIKEHAQSLSQMETKKKAISAAVRAAIVPRVKKREYSENNVTIATLESELGLIKAELAKYATNLSELVSREVLELKMEKDDLLRLRTIYEGRIRRANKDLSENRHIKSKHFAGLVEFFPSIDNERLAKIEEFHSGLARALRAELRGAEKEAQGELERVNNAIELIEAKMADTLNAVDEPTHLVDRVYDVATELQKARDENEFYEGEAAVRRDVAALQETLSHVKSGILAAIQKALNDGMRDIVGRVFGPDRKSPSITLRDRSYGFEVFEDTGTGTAYVGLIIFDLTVFSKTALPVVIHDSVLFKNVENDSVASLVDIYPKSGKQSFIALDEIDKYGDRAASILSERCAIQLGDEQLLFDKDWRVIE